MKHYYGEEEELNIMAISSIEAQTVLEQSEEIKSPEAVQQALDTMGEMITNDFKDLDPIIFVVMNGALIPAGHLLTRLNFPFQIGYLHATRYRGKTTGADLVWLAQPSIDVTNRIVLVVDDIFDEGTTLEAIVIGLKEKGATSVFSATLVNKVHDRKPKSFKVDYIGLDVPDRYVFGCGMDYNEYWRNLAGIWALCDDA